MTMIFQTSMFPLKVEIITHDPMCIAHCLGTAQLWSHIISFEPFLTFIEWIQSIIHEILGGPIMSRQLMNLNASFDAEPELGAGWVNSCFNLLTDFQFYSVTKTFFQHLWNLPWHQTSEILIWIPPNLKKSFFFFSQQWQGVKNAGCFELMFGEKYDYKNTKSLKRILIIWVCRLGQLEDKSTPELHGWIAVQMKLMVYNGSWVNWLFSTN